MGQVWHVGLWVRGRRLPIAWHGGPRVPQAGTVAETPLSAGMAGRPVVLRPHAGFEAPGSCSYMAWRCISAVGRHCRW